MFFSSNNKSSNAYTFLEYVLENILDEGAEFSLQESEDELGTLLELSVSEEHMGRIIGKQGQSINALRTLLRMVGSKEQKRINLKVLEPTG